MLESFEAVIDADGNIRIPAPVDLSPGRRAIVVLLEEDYVKQPPHKSNTEDYVKQPPWKSNTIQVLFIHPRDTTPLMADVDPERLTGSEALKELQTDDGTGAFLLPSQRGEFYGLGLKRGNSTIEITPNMTFAQAGVVNGDTIEIRLYGQGAGPGPAELVQVVFEGFAGAAVLLAFVKALRPIILKLLESKFRVVFREDSVEIEGDGVTSTNKIIKILEAIVKTKGLSLQEVKDETTLPGSTKVFSLKPAVDKKAKVALKRRSRSSVPPVSKTTTKSGDSGNKVARKKKSAKKRSS